MALLTLQLGQCGNQLGREMFDMAHSAGHDPDPHLTPEDLHTYRRRVNHVFFTEAPPSGGGDALEGSAGLVANAVQIDMEEKVVQGNIKSRRSGSSPWSYDPRLKHCKARGAGNNWANGYSSYGPLVVPDVLDTVQRALERMDSHSGFLVAMSLAGGTGSGLGTFVSEQVRDAFPKSFILSQVVWPYSSGEIILQDYNTLLSLSHLSQVSDGIVIFHNEDMQNICHRRLRLPHVTFSDINRVISSHLLGVLLPAAGTDYTPNSFGNTLTHVCCHPEYRLLSAKCVPHVSKEVVPFTNSNWETLERDLKQMLISDSPIDECLNWNMSVKSPNINRSLANMVVSRGTKTSNSPQKSGANQMSAFLDCAIYCNSTGLDEPCAYAHSSKQFNGLDKSMYLLSNSQSTAKPVDKLVQKCWGMFSNKAYLHQYSQFNVGESDFLDCFVALEGVIKAYDAL